MQTSYDSSSGTCPQLEEFQAHAGSTPRGLETHVSEELWQWVDYPNNKKLSDSLGERGLR